MATRSKKAKADPHKDFGDAITLIYKGKADQATKALKKLKAGSDDSRLNVRIDSYLKICERILQKPGAAPKDAESAYQRGIYAHNCGDFESARKSYKTALKKADKEDSAEILVALAATEAQDGETTAALTYLKKALQADQEIRFLAIGDPDFERLRQTDAFQKLVEVTD